ncbi:MAG: M23 family metallopeptidase [Spirochaetaceae bacterium]
MSPAHQYKKVEERIFTFFVQLFTRIGGAVAGVFRRIVGIGKQKFTIMLIPHSEKKVFNFHISVFSLVFISSLILFVIAAFFVFSTKFSGVSNLLTQRSEDLSYTKANLELVRDEITDLREVSQEFEKSLKDTFSSLGFESAEERTKPAAGGDLSSLINFEEQDSGIMREVNELRNIQVVLESSQESLQRVKGLLDSHGDLLVDLPTFWPIDGGGGRITNYFGPEMHPFTEQWYLHKGVDIAFRRGKEVATAANGKVVERKYDAMGFGNYIVIRHAYGFATKYAHLDSVYVDEGDEVTQGQIIGTMGNTGLSTGPHLHFEVRIGSQVVDPERFLSVQENLR